MHHADVAKIVASCSPVLCFDTCTALDLMRDLTRDTVKAHERQAALDLLNAFNGSGSAVLLMAEQVRQEFNENVDGVEKEAKQALEKLRKQIQRIDEVASVYGAAGLTNLDHLDDHIASSREIADQWISAAKLIREGPDILPHAGQRVRTTRTPAKKGKDSFKDCIVIETYLDIVTQLRNADLSAPIVFVSSNVKDYAEVTGSRPQDDLAKKFEALNLEYAPNLAAAKHLLNL